jgi:hypothetical protein
MSTVDRRGKENLQSAVAAARETARDSIAVLTLWKLATMPVLDTRPQSFGLALDVASVREDYWVTTTHGQYLSAGTALHGSVGPWEFQPADLVAFRRDPRFQLRRAADA